MNAMKKGLLMLALAAGSATAQDAVPSTYYSAPAEGEYYLYSIDQSRFVKQSGGNATALTKAPEDKVTLQASPAADGTYAIRMSHGKYMKLGSWGGQYLWTDCPTAVYWTFEALDGGAYRLSTAATAGDGLNDDGTIYYVNATADDHLNAWKNTAGERTAFALITEEDWTAYTSSEAFNAAKLATAREDFMIARSATYLHDRVLLPTEGSISTPTWEVELTSDAATWDEATNTISVVRRTDELQEVGTLQAYIDVQGQQVAVWDEPFKIRIAPDDNAVGYLYCHMPNMVPDLGPHQTVNQVVTFALGRKEHEGLVFNELNRGHAIYNDTIWGAIARADQNKGGKLPWCRDAHICKDKANGCYYIVTTDLTGSLDNGVSMMENYSIGMFKSYDLINWTYSRCDVKEYLKAHPVTDIYNDAGTALMTHDKVSRVWAPQTIVIDGTPYIYYAVGNWDNGGNDHFYLSRANRDFTGIESFEMLYGPNRLSNILDADIVYNEVDSLYHMSLRDYAAGDIHDITCRDLLRHEWNTEPVSRIFGAGGFEASTQFRRINSDEWVIQNIQYTQRIGVYNHVANALLRDLKDAPAVSGHVAAQHGSVVQVSQDEWDVVQRWSDIKAILETTPDQTAEGEALLAQQSAARAAIKSRPSGPIDMHQLAATLEAAYQPLIAAYNAYNAATLRRQLALAEGQDVSYLLSDAEEVTIDGAAPTTANGWAFSGFFDHATAGSGVYEFFSSRATVSLDMTRTLTGLAEGDYLVAFQGFERNGDNDYSGRDWREGIELINYQLVVGGQRTPIASLYSVPCDGDGSWNGFANDMGSAARLMADPDNFVTYLRGHVGEDGRLTIGLHRPETTVSSTSDWCCFKGFRLYRISDEHTGIGHLQSQLHDSTPSSGECYDLSGRRVQPTAKGLHITNGRKTINR